MSPGKLLKTFPDFVLAVKYSPLPAPGMILPWFLFKVINISVEICVICG